MSATTTQASPAVPPPELDRDGALAAARLFHLAGDATRLRILLALANGPRNVGQLCLALGGIGQPACSHHAGLLRHSMLISPKRVSQHTYYELTDRGRQLVGAIRVVVGGEG